MKRVLPWLPASGGVDVRSARQPLHSRLYGAARQLGSQVLPQIGRTGLILGVLSLALGMLFVAQLQSKPRQPVATTESRQEMAATTIKHLEQEQAELKKLIGEYRAQAAAQQKLAASETSTLSGISQELDQQKVLAGMTPLRGRGVKVSLDDSAATKIPQDDDPSLYIVHEYQLRDVLNLLWLVGAEAVSLNGERIVATTSIYCVGSTILVNDTRLSPPYEFLAIGDPVALEAAFNDPASLKALKARVAAYGLQLAVARQGQVLVPAYSGSLGVKYTVLPGQGRAGAAAEPAGGSAPK